MLNRTSLNSFLIISVLLSSGCATIFKSSTETVSISANVPCTHVYVDGKYKGTTPLKLKLDPKIDQAIVFRKSGYKTKIFILGNHKSIKYVVLSALGGMISILVDAATDSWQTFNTKVIHLPMTPQNPQECLQ
jgi:PEGA domain